MCTYYINQMNTRNLTDLMEILKEKGQEMTEEDIINIILSGFFHSKVNQVQYIQNMKNERKIIKKIEIN